MALLLALSGPAAAEEFPAFYSVAGAPANDVLDVRAGYDVAAEIVGSLPPNASGIEVLALSPDGLWASLNVGKRFGWVDVRNLKRDPGPDWTSLQTQLTCVGSPVAWVAMIDPVSEKVDLWLPEDGAPLLQLRIDWAETSDGTPPVAGILLNNADVPGFLTISSGFCVAPTNEVMGLKAELFFPGKNEPLGMSGCCSLVR